MMGSIGLTVGLIGYCLFGIIELLSSVKYQAVRCAPDQALRGPLRMNVVRCIWWFLL